MILLNKIYNRLIMHDYIYTAAAADNNIRKECIK